MRKALLIIDVQNDFLPGGALPVKEGDTIISYINKLQQEFDLVLATKDWHPEGHISFKSQWPVHCVQGTHGAQFPETLETKKIARVFYKGTELDKDSYSPFCDNTLIEYLRAERVTDVYIVGLATDYCVKSTALDAALYGFEVHVILEGCKGIDLHPGDIEKALQQMREKGVQID